MEINRENAMLFWEECYGNEEHAVDFHGNTMYKHAYGDMRISLPSGLHEGWNIHHILPQALGGTNAKSNLLCTNIITNEEAADKITFWIDDSCYQVKRIRGTNRHEIIKIN